MRRAKILAWIAALLALALPAVMAYLGSHSRLFADDYCVIAWGEQYGVLGGLRLMRDTWNGSFTNYFVQFLFQHRGEIAGAVMPALLIAIWLVGLTWLTLIVLRQLRVDEHRLPLALTVSGLLVASAINGFHSAQSFYWMAANVAYAMPLALLVLIIAITLRLVHQPNRHIYAAVAFVAITCFFNAGFSVMYLVFQGAVLTALLAGVILYAPTAERRHYLILTVTALLATAAAALVMMTAPGFSLRLNSDKYVEANMGLPVRTLPELFTRSFEITFEQIGYQQAFTGFALMICLSLLLTLSVYRPQHPLASLRPPGLQRRPLWAGFVVQLLFLPVLWAHTSDATHILGRFSPAFFLVICLNMAQILAFALLMALKRKADRLMRHNEKIWRTYLMGVLFAALLLFAMDQARSIHYKAATYLFSSAFVLLSLLLWQLADRVPKAESRLWRLLPLFAAGAALFSYLALIALSLFALGFLSERILAGAAFLHVASGVAWGLSLGILMRRSGLVTRPDGEASRLYRSGAALVVVVLASGIVIGQSQRLPELAAFATEWDARHQEIIRQRDSGSAAIVVPELSYNLGEIVYRLHIFDDNHNKCPKLYYGVESITRSGAG